MIERAVILALVVAAAFLVVWVSERLRPRGASLRPGITVVTGPDCRLCGQVLDRLEQRAIAHRRIDVADVGRQMTIRAVPTVLVADRTGAVVLRRAGKSAIADLDVIVSVAAAGGTVTEVR